MNRTYNSRANGCANGCLFVVLLWTMTIHFVALRIGVGLEADRVIEAIENGQDCTCPADPGR